MSPGLGVIVFGGLGYVLIYAAVANHGRFATHPWAGLLADAYDTGSGSSSSSSTSPGSSESSPAPANARPAATVLQGRGSPVRDRLLGVTA